MKRRWKALICALMFCAVSVGVTAPPKSFADDSIAAVAIDDETLIYRTSVEGKCEGISNESMKWDFVYALTAYQNGHIHIDVQCKSPESNNCNEIGSIQFNDSMIAAIDKEGYAGTSSFDPHKYSDSKYITSFSGTNIVYTVIYSGYSSTLGGEILSSFDLYVKSDYLTTNQTITFFGTEIEIPFGNPPVDKDAKITELEAKVEELEAKLTQSSSGENNTVGDVDGSGDVDAGDATVILQYAAYLGAGGTGTLPDYLAQLETA